VRPRPPPPPVAGRRCAELFAGAGGMALGVEEAGWSHVALYERDVRCCDTLRRNRPGWRLRQVDLGDVDWEAEALGRVDLLCGGPPCQPFSEGGDQLGAADERDGWPATLRAVEALEPTWCLFENVTGMLGTNELRDVLAALRARFEWVDVWGLCAADYGVPQERWRLFVVAGPWPALRPARTHAPVAGVAPWRIVLPYVSVRRALGLQPEATGIRRGHGWLPDRVADLDAPSQTLTTQAFGCGTDLRINDSGRLTLREQATRDATPKDAYGRLEDRPPDGWKWRGGDTEDDGLRRPTEAELVTLAGFPPDWRFTGPPTVRSKQRGNAVPPALARAVAAELLRA